MSKRTKRKEIHHHIKNNHQKEIKTSKREQSEVNLQKQVQPKIDERNSKKVPENRKVNSMPKPKDNTVLQEIQEPLTQVRIKRDQ